MKNGCVSLITCQIQAWTPSKKSKQKVGCFFTRLNVSNKVITLVEKSAPNMSRLPDEVIIATVSHSRAFRLLVDTE